VSGRRTARSNGVGVRLSRPVLALFVGAALVWLAGLIWFAGMIPNDVVDPYSPADAIVVLTGGSQRFETGLDLLAAGKGKQLFISGVHQGVTVADLMHQAHRAPDRPACCVVLGHEADSTLGNALETAAWMRREGYHSLRLVTAAYHMRRSLLEFARVMPEMTIIANPVFPEQIKLANWWSSPGTAVLIVGEYDKYLGALLRAKLDEPITLASGERQA